MLCRAQLSKTKKPSFFSCSWYVRLSSLFLNQSFCPFCIIFLFFLLSPSRSFPPIINTSPFCLWRGRFQVLNEVLQEVASSLKACGLLEISLLPHHLKDFFNRLKSINLKIRCLDSAHRSQTVAFSYKKI